MYEEEGSEAKLKEKCNEATQTRKSVSLEVSTQPNMYEEEGLEKMKSRMYKGATQTWKSIA